MKTFLMVLLSSQLTMAQTLTCTWQDSGTYEKNYYVGKAQFDVELTGQSAYITNDSYFKRKYSPCWDGVLSSCTFNFKFDSQKSFNVYQNSGTQILMEQQWWFTSLLELNFSTDISKLEPGEQVALTINGKDGESTAIIEDELICEQH